jgi:hypothetical protein
MWINSYLFLRELCIAHWMMHTRTKSSIEFWCFIMSINNVQFLLFLLIRLIQLRFWKQDQGTSLLFPIQCFFYYGWTTYNLGREGKFHTIVSCCWFPTDYSSGLTQFLRINALIYFLERYSQWKMSTTTYASDYRPLVS